MTTLIFLGAGASHPFGIPTMTKMVTKFEDDLNEKKSPEKNLYHQIKQSLAEGFESSRIDIESVFSVIHGIATGITPKSMGTFPYYYVHRFATEQNFSQQEIDAAKKLREELEKFIKKECQYDGSNDDLKELFERSYDVFFKHIQGAQKFNASNLQYKSDWRAYTTNYDLIYENYWAELAPVDDYFESRANALPVFDSTKGLGEISFIKLHGSLDWEKLEDGKIVKSRPSASYTRKKKAGTAMLYPIQQKDLYRYPWITMFQSLKHGLHDCNPWYVVGYAFNDEFVLDAFIELFTDGKQMIIINPHANELTKKFPENLRSQITPLPIRFGDEYFAKDFEDFSTNQRTLEIELQATSNHIGIDLPATSKYIENIKNENIKEEAIVTNHNNQTSFEFASNDRPENKQQKTISFRAQMMFDIDWKNVEIVTMNSDETNMRLTLKNQGRLIHTVTISAPQYDGSVGMYISKVNIDAKKFFPH